MNKVNQKVQKVFMLQQGESYSMKESRRLTTALKDIAIVKICMRMKKLY